MMKTKLMTVCLGLMSLGTQAQRISLAGEWNVVLDNSKTEQRAVLPGTIDTNRLGFAPTDCTETTHLTRVSAYKGAARYSRTINIPKAWKKKQVVLFLERTHVGLP